MSFLTIFWNPVRVKQIEPGEIMSPLLNLDGYSLSDILLYKSDFTSLLRRFEEEDAKTVEAISPFETKFGTERNNISGNLRKEAIKVDNGTNIPGHEILLLRRKTGKLPVASQFHFYHDRLFMLIDEFTNRNGMTFNDYELALNGYLEDIPELDCIKGNKKLIRDGEGNIVMAECLHNLAVWYYSPGLSPIGEADQAIF